MKTKELIMLADILDVRGFHDIANEIDELVKQSAKVVEDIHEQVSQMPPDKPAPQVLQFIGDLERTLTEKQRDPSSKIDYDVSEEIMSIIYGLIRANIYSQPEHSRGAVSMRMKAQNQIMNLIESIVELEDEVRGEGAYSGQEIDPKAVEGTKKRLEELYEMVQELKNEEGLFEMAREYYNEKRGKQVW